MNTYTKEISFLSPGFSDDRTKFEHHMTKVTACFKELSRTESDQHGLAMQITRTMRKFRTINEDKTVTVDIDDEAMLVLVKRYITDMSVFTDEYTAAHQKEILADVGALYVFGNWVVGEKCAPFFSILHET